jgi:TRAP-type C4-dicarboxylate transport system permease large subunit
MIIYSLAAGGVSVGALFMGGFIPGVLLGLCLLVVSVYMSLKYKYPKGEKVTLKEGLSESARMRSLLWVRRSSFSSAWPLGWFTATESAAIACVYAFIRFLALIYGELKSKHAAQRTSEYG